MQPANTPLSPPATRLSSAQLLALAIPLLAGAYLLLTSTVTLHETVWKYDVKRLLELGLLPLVLLLISLHAELRNAFAQQIRRIPRWMGAALLVLFALGVLSAVVNSPSAMSLAYSLAEVFLLSLLIISALCVAACRAVAGRHFDQLAMLAVALLGLAVGMQELLGVLAAWGSGLEFHPRVALLHFSWPRFYNQLQSWTLPALAALTLVFPGKPSVRLLAFAAIGLHWYVILATGGRGTALAVVISLAAVVILFARVRRVLLTYHLGGLLLGGILYGLVLWGNQQLVADQPSAQPASRAEMTEPAQIPLENPRAATAPGAASKSGYFMQSITGDRMLSSSGRTDLWKDSLKDARRHPLLGIGPMNYACTGPVYRAAHPHNFPLQLLGEWGVPAFLLTAVLGVFLALKLIGTLRSAAGDWTAVSIFLAAGAIAAALHAGLSGVMVMPASQVCGILLSGWLLGSIPVAANDESPAGKKPWKAIAVLLGGLVLAAALGVFAGKEAAVSSIRLQQTQKMDRLIPRFWQNGKVCRLYHEAVPETP